MSSHSRRIVLSPTSQADLQGILNYTGTTWNLDQLAVYEAKLDQAIKDLQLFPNRGRPRDDIAIGLRGLRIESHTIFYRVTERSIRIVRVLHEKMDPASKIKR
jgi:toxin ParE1/3/4